MGKTGKKKVIEKEVHTSGLSEIKNAESIETEYLINSEANKKRLQNAIEEMNSGISYKHELIEE